MKVGLVLEGGSLRGLYSAGVLDTFMDHDIQIDGMIGVSAGALFSPNYFSKQKGRALRYNKKFCKDKRFMSIHSWLTSGNLVNKQFAFYDITLKHDIFDNETFMRNNSGYYVTVSDVESGKAQYLEVKDIIKEMEKLRASSAIPLVSQIVEIDGKKYLDGGVADSIPVKQAMKMGYEKIIVIQTRDQSYRKKPLSKLVMKLVELKYRKYPNFIQTMKNRYLHYNQTLDEIHELKAKGQIFVIQPSKPLSIKSLEKDPNQLQAVYDLGVSDCKEMIFALKQYLNS